MTTMAGTGIGASTTCVSVPSLAGAPRTTIPLCDVRLQYLSLKQEIDAAMIAVAEAGNFILGPEVRAFQGEMSAYLECERAIGVANGTDALHLALRALDIGPDDEVITTPFTFVATTEAIGMVGATPVFVDIDPRTFHIDPNQVEAAITSRTKALLPVHLYGQVCDMGALLDIADRHGLAIVEDCAQALGARYDGRMAGTLGRIGCFSFFPSKNLGCFGDGGLVATNDPALGERLDSLRRHGGRVKYHHDELGLNSRLDELQAAILRVKLRHLEDWNRARRRHASEYNGWLAGEQGIIRPYDESLPSAGLDWVPAPRHNYSVYHQYTVRVQRRDEVALRLGQCGIGNAVYYPVPLHLQLVHRNLGYAPGTFPHAEACARECLSLPMFPELTSGQCEQAARELVRAVREAAGESA